jgi:hypothetical protein
MGEIRPEDAQLAQRARVKAGGPARLAQRFNVSKQAVNDWGRRRPIPRHLRPQLRAFVEGDDIVVAEPRAPYGTTQDVPPAVLQLVEILQPDAALEPLAGLPRGYMERYQARVRDVEQRLSSFAAQLQRELVEYRQLLIAESRQPKKR